MFGSLLAVGSKAPEFVVLDDGGNKLTLAMLRGAPTVLVFYPGDDTTICTAQLCEIRDNWNAFRQLGARVYGVNGQGQRSHRHFIEKHRFPFPLLADERWRMCRAYGCGFWIVRRTVYVIDDGGVIRYAQRGKPSTAEILNAVEGCSKTTIS